MAENCGNCRYFLAAEDNKSGVCRRYPPVPMVSRVLAIPQPKAGGIVYDAQGVNAYFPTLDPETGWCGDHELAVHVVN